MFYEVGLVMISFCFIYVSGTGFSAGGSANNLKYCIPNGFTYLNFDYCGQCS